MLRITIESSRAAEPVLEWLLDWLKFKNVSIKKTSVISKRRYITTLEKK